VPLIEGLETLSVGGALAHRATVDPTLDFLVSDEGSVTFGQLEMRAGALAASLAQIGVRSGDRIAIILPPSIEFVVSVFAAAKLGVTIVPLNPRLTRDEFRYMLRHSEAVGAVCVEEYMGLDYLELFEGLLNDLPELRYLFTVGEEDLWFEDRIFQFEDLVSAGEGRDFEGSVITPEEDIFALLYTAGTAGEPKGVQLTHANALAGAAASARALSLGHDDLIAGITGLFHVFGLGPALLGCVVSGSALVLQREFDAGETLDLIERCGATVHFGVPSQFLAELNEMERRPRALGSLRAGLVAGAAAGEDLIRAVEGTICPVLQVAYSLTEASGAVTMTHPEDSRAKRHGTVGRPLEEVEFRVLDGEGVTLPHESIGAVAVRSRGVTSGYYRQPEETGRSFTADGFLLTGDVGMLDEEGFLHLVGRRRDVIIRGGFSVYPKEIEGRCHAHPAVRDVVVVGVRDREFGEAVHAFVIPVEGAIVTGQELRDWCATALADYKVPDAVSFHDSFPRTRSGKIDRGRLAEGLLSQDTEENV
jgi:fatty-acyl-CoA synthase